MRPKVRSTLRYVSNNSIISQEIFEYDPVSRVENLMVCQPHQHYITGDI